MVSISVSSGVINMKALLVGILGVILTIMSGSGGYLLNNYLSRDDIEIEHVDLIEKNGRYKKGIDDFSQLVRCASSDLFSLDSLGTISSFFDISGEISLNKEEDLERFLFRHKLGWQNLVSEIEHLEQAESDLSDMPIFLLMRLNIPISYIDQASKTSTSTQIADVKSLSPDETFSIQTFLSKKRGEMERCVSKVTEMMMDIQNAKREKTGEIDIMVTLSNSGNTDGLIRSNGKMIVSGIEYPLDIIYRNDPENDMQGLRYTLAAIRIEKRSMVSVTFSLDDSAIPPAALKTLREIVKNRARIEFSVELRDFRDRTIKIQKEIIVRSAS